MPLRLPTCQSQPRSRPTSSLQLSSPRPPDLAQPLRAVRRLSVSRPPAAADPQPADQLALPDYLDDAAIFDLR
eukprot:13426757-Alexandrium_andersonii.AAC.1